jgi:hypothetical protein
MIVGCGSRHDVLLFIIFEVFEFGVLCIVCYENF